MSSFRKVWFLMALVRSKKNKTKISSSSSRYFECCAINKVDFENAQEHSRLIFLYLLIPEASSLWLAPRQIRSACLMTLLGSHTWWATLSQGVQVQQHKHFIKNWSQRFVARPLKKKKRKEMVWHRSRSRCMRASHSSHLSCFFPPPHPPLSLRCLPPFSNHTLTLCDLSVAN